jgi:general secretion pathway protein D
LRIVNRRDAPKRDLPVNSGSDPEKIPRKDDMVTQILPLRTGEASKLVENLRPLIPESATITANDASNSIIMTDTQTNIRRIASIINAIDSSISTLSTIRVFPLTHADAKELAEVLTQLFSPDKNQGAGGNGRDRRGGYGFPGYPGMPGMPPQAQQSEAKQAATRVVCVADEQSNSIVVAAPEEVIPTIKEIILQVDTSVTDATETQVFRLKHADAVELAQTFNSLYADPSTSTPGGQNGRGNNNNNRRGPGFPFPMFGAAANNSGSQSSRALKQAQVNAVGDPRTNSLIVTASHDTMVEIATLVGRLDETEAKKQRVYVHSLQHADAENVATILRNMFGDTTSANTRGSRLSERVNTGVESNAADSFSNSNNRGGGLR